MLQGAHENCLRLGICPDNSDIKHNACLGKQGVLSLTFRWQASKESFCRLVIGKVF